MGGVSKAFVVLFGLIALTVPALAEKRVALVIGNAEYGNVAPLRTPVKEAAAVAAMFRSAGFEVHVGYNLGVMDFRRAVREFAGISDGADIAIVYYSGHGIENAGSNFLIPVDARLQSDFDIEDEAVSLDRVIWATEQATGLRLIILDAGRENPFARTMRFRRSVPGRGLATAEPSQPNTLIAYSAKAGTVSMDSDSDIGPFTAALLKHLSIPGMDIRLAFGRVRDDVLQATAKRQEPFVYGSLGGSVVALISAAVNVQRDFELAKQQRTRSAIEGFIAKYGRGFEVDEARALLETMDRDLALRKLIARGKSYALIGQ